MTAYPLVQIILYLSLLLSPSDATRITITGPTPADTQELRVTVNGWAVVRDGIESPVSLSATRLLLKTGDKHEATEVGALVAPVKGHDWAAAPKLKLAGLTTLEKTDAGYIFRLNDDGGATAQIYTITYHRPTPPDPASTISVNVLGGGINKPGTYQLAKNDASLLQAIATAGGMNRLADRSRVCITRGSAGEKPTTTYYNVAKMISSASAPIIVLQDHDTIFIPETIF